MAYKMNDFTCNNCAHAFEEMYKDLSEVVCPACNSGDVRKALSVPRIAAFSIASPERRASMLKKRSLAHTRKEVAKEPERFGAAGIERQQATKNAQVGYTGK